jgi:hypothetical protein
MRENIDVFDFELGDDDMARIAELDTGRRSSSTTADPEWVSRSPTARVGLSDRPRTGTLMFEARWDGATSSELRQARAWSERGGGGRSGVSLSGFAARDRRDGRRA